MTFHSRQRAFSSLSVLALLALGACASSGHGLYLSGATGAAAATSGSKGEAAADETGSTSPSPAAGTTATAEADSPMLGDHMGSKPRPVSDDTSSGGGGGGGGGGDPATDTSTSGGDGGGTGGGGTGVHPQSRRATSAGGSTDMTADLLGGVLHTVGNAVLVSTTPVQQIPLVGDIAEPVIAKAADAISSAGLKMVTAGTDGIPIVGPLVDNVAAAVDRATGVAIINVGDTPVLAPTSATQAVAVNVASTSPTLGTNGTINILSGGQLLTVATGQPTNGAIATATGGTPDSLLGGAVGASTLATGAAPVLALNAGTSQPMQGTLATLGVMSNGQPVTLSVGALPAAGVVSLGAAASSVTTAVATVLSPSAGGNPVSNALAAVVTPVAAAVPVALASILPSSAASAASGASLPAINAVPVQVASVLAPVTTTVSSAASTLKALLPH